MVVWQLSTAEKRFLARMGGPLSSLCLDSADEMYFVTVANNSVVLVDASAFAIKAVVQGFKLNPIAPTTRPPIVYDTHERMVRHFQLRCGFF